MKWGKTALYAVSAALVGGLGGWVSNPSQPFTFKTIGIPALATLIGTLSGLFSEKPNAPSSK